MIKYILQNNLNGIFGTAVTVIAVSLEIIIALWAAGKFSIEKWKIAIIVPARYLLAISSSLLIYWLERGFKDFGGGALTRIYIYLPLLMYPVYRLLKIDWRRACDFLAIHFAAFQAPVHLGCIFSSCCYGYESSFGIWNEFVKHYTFPIQICDTITSTFILLIIIRIAKKKNYQTNGMLYPILLVIHGIDRLLWEFARDVRKIWLGLTPLQFHAMLMIIVGLVALRVMMKREQALKQSQRIKKHRKRT